MTNGDKIRNMTDRELAHFLALDDSKPCIHCMRGGHARCETDETFICTIDYVADVFTAWLASEAVSERSEKGEVEKLEPPVNVVLDPDACGNCEFLDDDGTCFNEDPCPHI